MPLATTAFLAIWHDIDPAFEPEWHRWHTFEHMPERVSIPGFLAGRRYMNRTASRQACFTMYEAADISVFRSPAYLERLNAPTDWTQQMAPAFQDFQRGACRCTAYEGAGLGGVVLALRFNLDGPADKARIDSGRLIADATAAEGISAAHIGLCEHAITDVETRERAARSATGENRYDAVFLVEGMSHAELQATRAVLVKRAVAAFAGYALDHEEIYDLAFALRESDL